ncbi:MAG TPA: MerR family transcriptional regulator [Solirubrobacteraceae bacterium]|nr:MerR family transcriptional regulator [Solirubrobacteraceae bacterium]
MSSQQRNGQARDGAGRAAQGAKQRAPRLASGLPTRAGEAAPEARRGVFMISVAAQLAEMHPQTLRTYEARGLITPARSAKGTRLYSQSDVDLLRRIQAMTAELGLNLAGVERVLALEAEVLDLRDRISELERREALAQERLAEAIEEVRRSFRAELVPYVPAAGTELVPARDYRRSLQWLWRTPRKRALARGRNRNSNRERRHR